MTPKERLYARLAGEPVDRVPNLSIIMLFAAKFAGYKYGPFCADYRVLVDAVRKTTEEFKLDILSTMSDPFRETHDFGAKLRFPEDDLPVMTEHLVKDFDEFDKIRRWDPLGSVRMLDRINAIRLFRQLDGDKYPILGWVEGAWAEFADIVGVQEAMCMIVDDPDAVAEAMEIINAQAIDCALAQIEAGADVIGVGDAAASLVSANMYREYMLPFEQKLIAAIHNAGARVKLHICGNTNHLLGDIATTGADIVDIDYMIDMKNALKLADGRFSLCGQINPANTIFRGTPELVRKEALEQLALGDRRFILSSGCEVPKMTPYENFHAIDEAIAEFGAQGR